MILSGKEINKLRKSGEIVIDPFCSKQLNPNSYDLRLHSELLVYKKTKLDFKKKNKTKKIEIPENGLWIKPNKLYLARTVEYTETHNLVPFVDGKSSIGRLGLSVHVTAGFGDIGFKGYWTLELWCVQPVRIYPNMKICQTFFHEIKNAGQVYNGKYQSNNGIGASKSHKDF